MVFFFKIADLTNCKTDGDPSHDYVDIDAENLTELNLSGEIPKTIYVKSKKPLVINAQSLAARTSSARANDANDSESYTFDLSEVESVTHFYDAVDYDAQMMIMPGPEFVAHFYLHSGETRTYNYAHEEVTISFTYELPSWVTVEATTERFYTRVCLDTVKITPIVSNPERFNIAVEKYGMYDDVYWIWGTLSYNPPEPEG